MESNKNKSLFLGATWLFLCLVSFGALNWYKLQPGKVGKISVYWPQNVLIEHERNFYNLVLFAHPKCGCTQASLVELEKLLNETNKKMKAKIFFYRPEGSDSHWSDGESKSLAMRLPQTEVIDDPAGFSARRFGAMTSGQVMVYSPEGKLMYAGGITESRGHIGDNLGSRSIASVVSTGMPSLTRQHTFGCIIFSEKELRK